MNTGKINLAGLQHVIQTKKGKSGDVKCLVIPIEQNHLFHSDNSGAVYLDIIAFEMKEAKDYGTHIVKQSLPKDVREAMSEEDKKKQPILGNLLIDGSGGIPSAQSNNAAEGVLSENDDLPF